jgi:signal transduction histidine kinase
VLVVVQGAALVTYLGVGALVLARAPRGPLTRAFAGATGALLLHATGSLLRTLAVSEFGVRGATFLLQVGLHLVIPLLLHFTHQLVGARYKAVRVVLILLWTGYLPLATLASLSDVAWGTRWVVALELGPDGWAPIAYGPGGIADVAFFIGSVAGTLVVLAAAWRRSRGLMRVQLEWFAMALGIGAIMGALAFATRNPFLTTLGTLATYLLLAYAITRYRFLDIQLVVRLGAVYVTVGALLLALYAGIVAGGTYCFGRFLPPDSWGFPLAGIAAVALLFDPMRDRVRRILDKAFFRRQLGIEEALESLSLATGRVRRAADLQRLLAESLTTALQPASIRLYVRSDPADRDGRAGFRVPASHEGPPPMPIAADDPVVARCRTRPAVCDRDVLAWELEQGDRDRTLPGAGEDRRLLDHLDREGIALALPLERGGELLGLLLLGPKLAQIPYRAGETAFARAAASQAALTLQNIWLNEAARSMEKDLHEADKLASLGAVASEIAHEVRNPLSVIKTYVRLLPEKGGDPEFLRRFQERTSPELDRMEGILNNILEGASGRKRPREEVRLEAVAEATLDFFSEEFARRGVAAVRDWSSPLPPLRGDPGQIRQVFQNLIQNAVQAMTGGGRLRVGIRPGPDSLHVEVADTGPGIPPDHLGDLFRPFASSKPTGTGLGLAISRRIVQQHGGSIRVESVPGNGTVFYVVFPVEMT